MRNVIWYSYCDSKTNEYFCSIVTERYKKYDISSNIFLTFSASGSVAAWGIWEKYPILWLIIVILTQIIQFLKPFFLFPKYIEIYNEKFILLQNINNKYEDLWIKLENENINDTEVGIIFDKIKSESIQVDRFPNNLICLNFNKIHNEANENANRFMLRYNS